MNQLRARTSRQSGITMIEILIVVVIVSILATIGYPSYMSQVRKSNRTDAREALSVLANDMERFFAANRTYTTDLSGFSMPTADGVTLSKAGHYVLTAAAGNTGSIASSFTLTAVPDADSIQAGDTVCPSLSLDSAGTFSPDPTASDCW